MKNIYILLSASLLIASCGPTTVIQSDSYHPAPAPAPVVEVSYQSFYDQLSPYGNWVNYPGYGYVWMPNAGPDFRPYATNGNWIYTDAGWTWASNYSWGWAPFHYGRWFFENGYGWIWIPGNEWAPAWVSWRGGNDYYGWAPLGPRISVDVALNSYNPPTYYWNFVPRQYMGNPHWHNYYVNQNRNVTIINNTTIINNYSGTNRGRYAYAPGPDPVEVRRVSGNNFAPVQVRETNSPGERLSGNQYMIYHPRVSNTALTRGNAPGRPSAAPAPARYESFNNVRPSNQYRVNEQPPVNNQPANNPRPVMSNTGYNQPNTNSQPANNRPQNPNDNGPANNARPQNPNDNVPADNARPQNPTYTRPNYPQPANNRPQNPNDNGPATNGRPQNPNYDPAGNNPPANNPQSANNRPQNQANNQPANNPAPQNRNNDAAVGAGSQPASRDLNKTRVDRFNQGHSNARPAQTNAPAVQTNSPANTPAENPAHTTGRPATVHNPNNGHPVQRAPGSANKPENKPDNRPDNKPENKPNNRPDNKPENKPDDKPEQKPVNQPKTREANNN